jgi:hypothetical protein
MGQGAESVPNRHGWASLRFITKRNLSLCGEVSLICPFCVRPSQILPSDPILLTEMG